jgi:hypothetical protein
MPSPGEHKTVQARILAYAQEIGWKYVPRGEAQERRGFDHSKSGNRSGNRGSGNRGGNRGHSEGIGDIQGSFSYRRKAP